MRWLENRKQFNVFQTISESVAPRGGLSTAEVMFAGPPEYPRHSSDDATAAMAIGVGCQFLFLLAHFETGERPARFYRALTADSGEAAGIWVAHCLIRRLPNGPDRPAFDTVERSLQRLFPLPSARGSLFRQLVQGALDEHGVVDPRDLYPYFTREAMGVVFGNPISVAPPADEGKGDPLYSYEHAMELTLSWGTGKRKMFRLIDPAGYEAWAAERDVRPLA